MEADDARARLGELGDEAIDWLDHQVHVDRQFRARLERRAYDRSDREVRHVVVVHDVEVQQVRAGRFHRAHFLAQAREIRRQDRGRDAVPGCAGRHGGRHFIACPYNARMAQAKRYEITVSPTVQYLPDQSDEKTGRYVFAYTISIRNTGDATAQLIS